VLLGARSQLEMALADVQAGEPNGWLMWA